MTPKVDVVVVGAGLIGLPAAPAAQARGLTMTVLDRIRAAAGASAGNAGAFAFSDILPLASPGILSKAPKWLLHPLGPLSIPPAYALRIAPWMYRFWRACSPAQVAKSTRAQTALMDLSKAELAAFLNLSGTAEMLRRAGNLQLHEGKEEFTASLPGWQARADHGTAFEHLTAAKMAELQPGLAPRFTRGTFLPDWYSIADPKDFALALADRLRARGGDVRRAEVVKLEPRENGVAVWWKSCEALLADKVVLAAGAFSHFLARGHGDRIPQETERGHNTTLPTAAFDLRMQATFGGHGFVASPLSTGVCIGGAVEFGGLKPAPNCKRADAMLRKAQTFLPGLDPNRGVPWMGFRPSLPDSLPAIGRSRATSRVIHAFGHEHLGLTRAAGTERLVADLLTVTSPKIDLTPFSPQRF